MSAPAKVDTVRDAILEIASDAPPNPYAYPRTYIVRNGRNDGRLDLDPPPTVTTLKSLAGVPVWGPAGYAAVALPGDRVVVIFRDADPRSGCVVAFEALTTGRHPSLAIDADRITLAGATDALAIGAEVRRVVCYGDAVAIPVAGGSAVGTIVQNPASAPNPISKVSA